jgi:hypothetical protein
VIDCGYSKVTAITAMSEKYTRRAPREHLTLDGAKG